MRPQENWSGSVLGGAANITNFPHTAIGRTTVATLGMNLPHRVALREALIAAGLFPPR
jgi:hypothetical protein